MISQTACGRKRRDFSRAPSLYWESQTFSRRYVFVVRGQLPPFQEAIQLLEELSGVFRFTFPNHAQPPAKVADFTHILFIPPMVALQLRPPKLKVGLWNVRSATALMLMPEASPDFDNALQPGEHEIGLAGHLRHVEPIAVSHAMNQPPYDHFRQGVPAANPAHDCRAEFRGKRVQISTPLQYFPNFFRSQPNTARCSSWPARRICDSSQITDGFSPVMFFAP